MGSYDLFKVLQRADGEILAWFQNVIFLFKWKSHVILAKFEITRLVYVLVEKQLSVSLIDAIVS